MGTRLRVNKIFGVIYRPVNEAIFFQSGIWRPAIRNNSRELFYPFNYYRQDTFVVLYDTLTAKIFLVSRSIPQKFTDPELDNPDYIYISSVLPHQFQPFSSPHLISPSLRFEIPIPRGLFGGWPYRISILLVRHKSTLQKWTDDVFSKRKATKQNFGSMSLKNRTIRKSCFN